MPETKYYLARSNADLTSEKAYLAMAGFFDVTSCTAPYEHTLHKFFSERVLAFPSTKDQIGCQRIPLQASAYPFNFLTNLLIEAFDANVLIHRFKETQATVVYWGGKIQHDISIGSPIKYNIEGPSDNAWTVSMWLLDAPSACKSPSEEGLSAFKKDMQKLLSDFKSSQPLSTSNKLAKMAEKVASQISEQTENEINAWAEALSEDVSKHTD